MAQAARLNLRMQKEVKLLLTDPPPAASFPSLSSDHHSSLTSIDAHFQGPEGTVYANGVFKIKIQIPERYPFQPPIVTFATPIYHPNIDNGGRICLDILNLPPKGTWKPSLNISAVLTSIGLLLSEPNPDDGLMHEASREYKYNRQAFDQNARSMTEKYARAGEESEGSSTAQTEIKGPNESICTNRDIVEEICKGQVHDYANKHTEIAQFTESKEVTIRNKLSLKVPIVSNSTNVETTNMNLPNQCSSLLEIKSANYKDATARDSRGSTSFKLKNVSLSGSLPSLPLQCPQYNLQNEKENLVPSLVSKSGIHYNERMRKQAVKSLKLPEMAAKPPFKPLDQILGSNGNIIVHSKNPSSIISDKKQQINEVHDSGDSSGKFKQFIERSPIPEAVVVLDSEDSEDENVPVRSKLSLARRCLSRKRKPAI